MIVSLIVVYETFAAPFVTSVELIGHSNSPSTTVFSGADNTQCGAALNIFVPNPTVSAQTIKINTQVWGCELTLAMHMLSTKGDAPDT